MWMDYPLSRSLECFWLFWKEGPHVFYAITFELPPRFQTLSTCPWTRSLVANLLALIIKVTILTCPVETYELLNKTPYAGEDWMRKMQFGSAYLLPFGNLPVGTPLCVAWPNSVWFSENITILYWWLASGLGIYADDGSCLDTTSTMTWTLQWNSTFVRFKRYYHLITNNCIIEHDLLVCLFSFKW